MTVVIETCDGYDITISVSLSEAQILCSCERIARAVKCAISNEVWKKIAVHGTASHLDVNINVDFGGWWVTTYSYPVQADVKIDVKHNINIFGSDISGRVLRDLRSCQKIYAAIKG